MAFILCGFLASCQFLNYSALSLALQVSCCAQVQWKSQFSGPLSNRDQVNRCLRRLAQVSHLIAHNCCALVQSLCLSAVFIWQTVYWILHQEPRYIHKGMPDKSLAVGWRLFTFKVFLLFYRESMSKQRQAELMLWGSAGAGSIPTGHCVCVTRRLVFPAVSCASLVLSALSCFITNLMVSALFFFQFQFWVLCHFPNAWLLIFIRAIFLIFWTWEAVWELAVFPTTEI